MQPAQNIKGTEVNGKQEQRGGGIKFELVILIQRTTLSKFCSGTLDVA